MADQRIGGEGGIRTPGTVPRTLDFESSAFNRARPPHRLGGHTSGLLFAFKPFLVFIGTTLLVLWLFFTDSCTRLVESVKSPASIIL